MRKVLIILICFVTYAVSGQDFKLRTTVRINPSGFYDMTYSNNYSFGVTGGIMLDAMDVNGCDQLNLNYPISVRNNPINTFPPNSTSFSCTLDWNGDLPTNTFVGFVFPSGITARNPVTGQTITDFSSDGTNHSVPPSTVFEPCRTYVATDNNANPDLTDITLYFVPTTEIIVSTIDNNELEIDEPFQFVLESGNPVSGWEYTLDSEAEFFAGTASWTRFPDISRTLQDLGLAPEDIVNDHIIFRGIACGNINVNTNGILITFRDSSIELAGPAIAEDASCFGENNGSVTLNFEDNVTENYEMRYYIYSGDPSSFPSNELLNTNPTDPSNFPEVIADPRFTAGLVSNPDGTFSGRYTGLGEGNYYVLYQEVNYSTTPVEVKSGRLTESFTIQQPTQVTLNTGAPNFFTDTSCGNPAVFELNNTASGGNNLDASGSYSYEYSTDDINYVPVGTDGRLEIPATSTAQNIWVRGVYTTATTPCPGEAYQYTISAASPPLSFANPSTVNASTTSATDGSVRVEFSGGSGPYSYALVPDTGATPVAVNLGNGAFGVTYNNLPEGSYTVQVSYTENSVTCTTDSPTLTVGVDPIPILGTPQTTQILCIGDQGRIAVPVFDFNPTYRYQWEINGNLGAILTDDEPTILLDNITTAGTYVLRVGPGRISNSDFNDAANLETVAITMETPEVVAINEANGNPVSCFGLNDGSLDLILVGGSSYEYTLVPNPAPTDWLALNGNTIPNLGPGSYEVRVRNQNGCVSNAITATIDAAVDISISEAVNPVSTINGNDGSITLTVSGGTGNYSFAWTGPNGFTATDQNITALFTGSYSVTVTDTNTCTATLNDILVPEPGPLQILATTPTPTSCFGANDGSILIAVQSSLPVTYRWFAIDELDTETFIDEITNSTNALTIAPLAAGRYRVSVQDADTGPLTSDTIEIAQPTEITADISTAASCFNADTGIIAFSNVQGGSLGIPTAYSFSIDNGATFQPNAQFEDLAAGTYNAVVRENNTLCTVQFVINLDTSPEITYNPSASALTNVSQNGANDGSISPVFDGLPNGDLTFLWEGPNVGGVNTQNISGLAPGTYTITAITPNACAIQQDFEITEPGPLNITLDARNDISCFGANDGSIFTTVQGEGTITYTWMDENGTELATTAEDDIENLPPGSYTLTVSDTSTNPDVSLGPLPITAPDLLVAEAFATDASCAMGNDGSITLNVTGGSPGYEFSIDSGNTYQTSNTFTGLMADNYAIRVRDANACTVELTALVNEPLPIGIQIDVQQPLSAANAADGLIVITAFGGTGNLTYTWTGPPSFTPINSDRLENLPGGDYQVTITDENFNPSNPTACSFTSDIITIAEPGELVVNLEQTVFLECNGNDFAEIIANVQGGVSPYTFEWLERTGSNTNSLAEASNIIANLSAGTYFVRVTDANGIAVTSTDIQIVEPEVLEIQLNSVTNIACAGQSTGAIAITVTGGTAPYQYSWSNGMTVADLNNIPEGTYNLNIVDSNGCFSELDVAVEGPENPLQIVSPEVTNLSQYQANDGRISIQLTGGTAPYTILWTRDSDGVSLGNGTNLDDLQADSYTVSVIDANGCEVSGNFVVTQPDIIEETIIPPSCNGADDASISLLVNQGNGAFTYLWNTGATTNGIANIPAGTYSVTISGFANGPETRSYTIEDPIALTLDLDDAITLCAEQDAFFDITIADATARYRWESDNGFTSTAPEVLLTQAGTYTASIETLTGCTISDSVVITLSADEIDAQFAMSSQIFTGETLILVDISFPIPDTVEWLIPSGATLLEEDTDSAEIRFDEAGEYQISMLTTKGSCTAIQTKKVLVLDQDGLIDPEGTSDGPNAKQIEDFILYPNPSSGTFTADVKLTDRGSISIRVFSFANNLIMADEKRQGEVSYAIPFDLSGMPSGVYAVVLETPYGTSLRKIIIA